MITLGTEFGWPGLSLGFATSAALQTDATLDAAAEYASWVIQADQNMVVSHVGWQTGAVSGSPTADVRIETVDASGNPSGTLWATNTNLVTGTLTANTFNLTALTAAATINLGDLFAVKILYNSGTAMIVQRGTWPRAINLGLPYGVLNTSGSAVKVLVNSPIVALGSNATTFYHVPGVFPVTSYGAANVNSTGGARRGLRFRLPFACRCVGFIWYNSTVAGDAAATLYDDAGGSLTSIVIDGDHHMPSGSAMQIARFSTPINLAANTWYRAALVPSTATNINVSHGVMPSTNYISAWLPAGDAHLTTYTTAGGWVDSATTSVPIIDILVDQIDGGGGISRARGAGGF